MKKIQVYAINCVKLVFLCYFSTESVDLSLLLSEFSTVSVENPVNNVENLDSFHIFRPVYIFLITFFGFVAFVQIYQF